MAALHIRLELPSNEAVRAAVEAGLGATVISASIAAPSIEAGLLHQVDFHLPAVANYVFPKRWPDDREQRARIIGEWLQTEARFLA